ncbi:cell division protein ZipA C-terminal FtsZ-binding domain-containing protein [Paraburkholderia hayleyella]|uniref:cell division protein ZipA C-terminal FtsZ-binding domain-containing protein n=1 Tax=Paraburkholderia hayleyella TaxID=2152889 RepID=UPI001291ACFB|nr:cell division protein ZipA C-terminal FtsZ-binding domain-containing protein [Paraburkholderia hayleyella]
MDELTLGLIGAGAVVVGGVVLYNAWQGAKVRRKLPQPAPDEIAENAAREEPEPSPFIESTRAAPRREAAPDEATADHARFEPMFGAEAGSGVPAQAAFSSFSHDAAEGVEGASDATQDSDPGGVEPLFEATSEDSAAAQVRGAASAVAVVDRRIDCIVPLTPATLVAGDKALMLAQRLRRAGSKPVHIEGQAEGSSVWEPLQNGVRYAMLRAAVQLANRSGALNELEFSEFVTGVQQFADAIDAAPEFPDMMETVSMARELDAFAAQCDAQLSINVLSDGAPWSANYVQAVASQDGLLLSRDGTRFVKLDAKQNPAFMLQFGDTNFLRDDLTYKGGQMIALVLDVPVADEDILPFRLICDYAKSLAERIGGRVVDEQRRALPEPSLLAIEKQLMALYARLEQAGIPAGSPATRRLFSQ